MTKGIGSLIFNCLFWSLFIPALVVYVGVFVLVGMAKAAIGKPPAWWVSS